MQILSYVYPNNICLIYPLSVPSHKVLWSALQVFGKFNIAGALRDQGINPLSIVEGRNADAQFPFSNYSRQQLALVNHLVDHIYQGFIQKVLTGQHACPATCCNDSCSLLDRPAAFYHVAMLRQG